MSDQLKRLQQSQKSRRETLAQFRSSRLHELPLPSGITVWVREVSMMDLMLTGKLPENIIDFAEAAEKQGAVDIDLKKIVKSGTDFNIMLNTVALATIVEPPVSENGDDDHLGLDEINGDDKMAIFNWVNREVEQLRPFREGENKPVAVVQSGNGLRSASE
jgi:hypothetical protein